MKLSKVILEMKTQIMLLGFLVVAGFSSCTLPPINFYHVSTGYFITDKDAEAYMDKKIELYVTDPKTENKPEEIK